VVTTDVRYDKKYFMLDNIYWYDPIRPNTCNEFQVSAEGPSFSSVSGGGHMEVSQNISIKNLLYVTGAISNFLHA
jgi:hypothetical protein